MKFITERQTDIPVLLSMTMRYFSRETEPILTKLNKSGGGGGGGGGDGGGGRVDA